MSGQLGAAVAAVAAAILVAACGGEAAGITADTTCQEYLAFDDEARGAAVRTIGAEQGWVSAANPMSLLSFDAHCGQRLDQTMSQAVGLFAKNDPASQDQGIQGSADQVDDADEQVDDGSSQSGVYGELSYRNDPGEPVPVPGVRVSVMGLDGVEVGHDVSGNDGAWEVSLSRPGDYVVRLDERTLPTEVRLRSPERDEIDLPLDSGQSRPVVFALVAAEERRSYLIRFVDEDGWSYSANLDVPAGINLSKDTSSSPPGKARLRAELINPYGPELDVPTDNPGRPNGPRRGITIWYVVAGERLNGGPCFSTVAFTGPPTFDIDGTLCRAFESPFNDRVAVDADEAVVDAAVATAADELPVLVAMGDWGMGDEGRCSASALIQPDGSVQVDATSSSCTLTVTVE